MSLTITEASVTALHTTPLDTLRSVFGFPAFREGQEAVVSRLLDGKSVLAVFPTGAGKSLFVGSLKFSYLARLPVVDGKVGREERLLSGVGRVRDVRQGPDGFLYLLTDEGDGKLVRVAR